MKFYRVGGCVRDKLLDRKCNDIDYSVEAPSYDAMKNEILDRGGDIFLESPEYLTIRARIQGMGACDFVLCRKDGDYSDGRRPDAVEPGTIEDDLARRDFTMNAIAYLDGHSLFIDPHNGINDINRRMVKCVGWVEDRFGEDGLRALRALRFSVTLDFGLHGDIHRFLLQADMKKCLAGVSVERVRDELYKMFKANTYISLLLLEKYPSVKEAVFSNDNGLWLMPTMKGTK